MLEQATRMCCLSSAIFTEIDELRKVEIAKGVDVITLSIGSPDLAPASHVVAALTEAALDVSNYGYTLSKGNSELLQAISDWYSDKFGVTLDPKTEIHSLIGSQEGLAHIGLCLVNQGDVVLLPDPGYPIYSAGPMMAEPELHYMPLLRENNYLPDLDAIDISVLKRTKMMILNYPNNPLAATAPPEFFEKVVSLASKYSFLVCHDFAYSELVFDEYRPPSFLSIPGAKEVSIEFHSFSKTYNMAGCRIGFVVGNAHTISLLGRLKSNFDYGIFLPIQKAAIAALRGSQDSVKETACIYQRRRDIIVDGLAEIGWFMDKPQATMYVWAPVPTKQSSFEFTIDLLKNTGVAVIPGIAFGRFGEGYIRFALVQPEQKLIEAVNRIKAWLG